MCFWTILKHVSASDCATGTNHSRRILLIAIGKLPTPCNAGLTSPWSVCLKCQKERKTDNHLDVRREGGLRNGGMLPINTGVAIKVSRFGLTGTFLHSNSLSLHRDGGRRRGEKGDGMVVKKRSATAPHYALPVCPNINPKTHHSMCC